MFAPALKAENYEYSRLLNQVLNARYIDLIWIQVKKRVLTCLFKGKKTKNNSSRWCSITFFSFLISL